MLAWQTSLNAPQKMHRWPLRDRSEVETHFGSAAATLLGPTVMQALRASNRQRDIVTWALVRWLFVETDADEGNQDDDDEDVKDKKEALCVMGPGLLESATRIARDCPLPELCGDPNPPPVVAQFTVAFVAAQKQRWLEHRARQCQQSGERAMAVARRLWARVVAATQEQRREDKQAVEVAVLLGGISLMLRLLGFAGAAVHGTHLTGGTLDEAFDDRFTSCLLNHPHTAVVIAAVKFVPTAARLLHLLPLGQGPEEFNHLRTFHQLRRLFHDAADSRVRRAALITLVVKLQRPELVPDMLERCAQETDAAVLAELYCYGRHMVESSCSVELLVAAAQRGLNHCDEQVVLAAISMVVLIIDRQQREGCSEGTDELYCMIAMAVSRLCTSSEPGVKSLLRLTAARIAAAHGYHHHHHHGALLKRLPQELQDLIGEYRASLQCQEESRAHYARWSRKEKGAAKALMISPLLPAREPLLRALRQVAASQLVSECSWQLRESGLLLLAVMAQIWTNSGMLAFVEEHWAFLVATLNDPVAQVRLRCCHTIAVLLASDLPIKQDYDRLSHLVDEGLFALLSREMRAAVSVDASSTMTTEAVLIQALDVLHQVASNESPSTRPVLAQQVVVECVLKWIEQDGLSRARVACTALVATIDTHLPSHNLRVICPCLALLVALWPRGLDENYQTKMVQCIIRVLADQGIPKGEVHSLLQQCPNLQSRVHSALGRNGNLLL